MRNKVKQKMNAKHARFKHELETLYTFMNKKYPGWEKTKEADHIKKRLHDAAKMTVSNIKKIKTKVVKKEDYPEIWPFTDDIVIIKQTSKIMISVMIDFKEYALNGLAQSALPGNLKFPHDAKKAIKGKSVSEFIKIGRGL